MQVEALPAPPVAFFRPGSLEQDLYTLPIELLFLGVMNVSYTRSAEPLWPFKKEHNFENRNRTRHPIGILLPAITGISVGTFGVVSYFKPHLEFWTLLRGFVHAHFLTEIGTSLAKLSFQRKRPFADRERARGASREDDRKSFFSGHASHSFAFATYSSLVVFKAFNGHPLTSLFGLAAVGGAWHVAATRAKDKQHHVSDVVAGSLFGMASSYFVFDSLTHSTLMVAGKPLKWEWGPLWAPQPDPSFKLTHVGLKLGLRVSL